MVKQALISVSNKDGIIEFSKAITSLGINIISTSGTAKLLKNSGIIVSKIDDYIGCPEIFNKRIKTLHHKIYCGLLARRDSIKDMKFLKKNFINPIDLLVVNLYPFSQIIAKKECKFNNAIENIDIGGLSMLRAAAKNFCNVITIVDPKDYLFVIEEMRKYSGEISYNTKYLLALKVFSYTSYYDHIILNYLFSKKNNKELNSNFFFDNKLHMIYEKHQDLSYGENPHQKAVFYKSINGKHDLFSNYKQLQGKQLSYNNISDSYVAWKCVKSFDMPACVIVKHKSPCGAAISNKIYNAYIDAFKSDSISAFGSIIACNKEINSFIAKDIIKYFIEVLIAPSFSKNAIKVLENKKKLRLLKISCKSLQDNNSFNNLDLKSVNGSILAQSTDLNNDIDLQKNWDIVTKRIPTEKEIIDLVFSWNIVKFIRSNAIIFCKDGKTIGIGAGQTNRIDSVKIAYLKAKSSGALYGSVVASDAFFPFYDSLDIIAKSGATCIIQPGGSIRDNEVINVANNYNISMIFTKKRCISH